MPFRDSQAVLQKLGETALKVDTYFLQRTGFVANQTVLKLGEYNVHCVPATIGVSEVRLLAVLTPAEINLFLKFKGGTQILILAFDDPESHGIARFHLRVALVDVVPVADRKNVCFVLAKPKALPGEFVLFLGDFLEAFEARKEAWEARSQELLPVDPGAKAPLASAAVVMAGDQQARVTVGSFHTKRVVLTWESGPPWAPATAGTLKVVVRGHPLVLEGTLDTDGAFLVEFQPEWLSFIEDVLFQKSMKGRGPGRPAE